MNIRYFRRKYVMPYADYDCVSDNNCFYVFNGRITERLRYIAPNQIINDRGKFEVFYPNSGPIEERYINATDRPSVEGFKYPELHPVNDVES